MVDPSSSDGWRAVIKFLSRSKAFRRQHDAPELLKVIFDRSLNRYFGAKQENGARIRLNSSSFFFSPSHVCINTLMR